MQLARFYFQKDEDADIRAKFEYARRADVPVIVAGDPHTANTAARGALREGIRSAHRHP